MATSVVFPRVQFFADNGRLLIGGRIHTYIAGTSSRAPTYKDAARAQPNTNPIILDGRAEASIYLAEGVEYKFVVEDSNGALIMTQEPVYGAIWPNAEDWPSDATLAYQYMLEAKAAASAIGPIKFYDTYAQADGDLPNLSEDDLVEIAQDETRASSPRARYRVESGALVFVIEFDIFYPNLTGSMPRPIQSKLRETVSVKDFGAVGDGVADDTAAFLAAAAASPSGFFAPRGDYFVTEIISPPVFCFGGLTITGGGALRIIDLAMVDDQTIDSRPVLAGRRANQVFQLAPPTLSPGVSTVSQGLMINKYAGIYYATWNDGSGNVIFRKFGADGVVLAEFAIGGLGHGDSLSPANWEGETVYLMGGSGPSAGLIHIIKNDVLAGSQPVTIADRAGGCAVAVDQFRGDKVAIFYRNAAGDLRIAHSIPLADVMNGEAISNERTTFTFTLPDDDGIGVPVDMQSIGYYNSDILIWAGNDSRSGLKLLSRYNQYGMLLERLDVKVDRLYADVEGNISEPEGMSIAKNPITGACEIYLTKCFGTHNASIIRVYELAGGESHSAVFVEGMPERDGAGQVPLRIVDIPVIFEKTPSGWIPNNGNVVASTGKMAAKNVRVDVGGSPGLYFDLYKPYVSLVGFYLSQSAGLTGARVFASWSVIKGGSTSNKDQKISLFNINTNQYISPSDGLIGNGSTLCLTLRVGMHH